MHHQVHHHLPSSLFSINIGQPPHSSFFVLQSQIHTTIKITPLLHTLTSISFHILEPHLRTRSVSIPNMVPLKKYKQTLNLRNEEKMKRELQSVERDIGEAEIERNQWEEKC
ncbi:unnamed protein product [Lactuca saligna]|uniref:Uncharacterized protein n=1 Tax=Lactuca saligna TaxID=75948 RepID=A0AA35Z3N3_LACSI|nr:unnamed protein product [Lactuca saligna]